ncbi:WD40 repeat domain-containing protein [Streptomyces sp. NPDC002055]|uniref:WD40 repeat domain-containing protein n=1 Tax=Streptomyces sp. NPDC002055 TaxID=3154534 RepID=UPI00331E847A
MAEIIDYGRFAERLQEKRSRWALLDEVQREWGYEDPGGEPPHSRWGGENSEYGIDEDLPIPEALGEWWDSPVNSFAFRPRLYWTHTQWPPSIAGDELPDDTPHLGADEDLRVCVFMSEYQYCNQWGYLAAEAGRPDPRVFVSTGDGWVVQSRSLSEFFLQLAMERMPGNFGWSLRIHRTVVEDDAAIVERLRASYRELGLLPWQEMGTDALSYGGPDALIRHGRGPGADFAIVIHGRTREALVQVADTLGVPYEDGDIKGPSEVPAPLEDLRPVALAAGDTDDRGRWTVVSAGAAPEEPAVPRVTGLDEVTGRTVVTADQDGTTVVAGDRDGAIHLWATDGEAPSEAESRALHRAPVTGAGCVRMDSGRRVVVSGDSNGVLRFWLTDKAPRRSPFDRRRTAVTAVAAGKPGTGPAVAAAWADGLVRVWDLYTDVVADLRLGTGIQGLALDADGLLRVTGPDGTAVLRLDLDRLWPTRKMREQLDEIDWSSFWTARGPADENGVSDLIVRIGSDDEATAKQAVHDLYRLIVSKDGSLTAAAPAVPFLVELMTDPANRARGTLLLLIADIADLPDARGDRGRAQRAAVQEALPVLLPLLEDDDTSVRWAAGELQRICAGPTA